MKSLETAILALAFAVSACSTTQQPQPKAWVPHTADVTIVKCAYGPDKEEAREFAEKVALHEFRNYTSAKPQICYHQNPDEAQCVRVTLQEQDCYR